MKYFCPACGEFLLPDRFQCTCNQLRPPEGWEEMFEPGFVYVDRFEIVKQIFGSPASIVYEAIDTWEQRPGVDRRVALKVLSFRSARRPRAAADFIVFKKLQEQPIDGIVEFVHSDRKRDEQGRYRGHAATRLCEHGDAAQNRDVFAGRLLETLIRVLQVLIAVHGRGFLVRDGKPENWLMPDLRIDLMILGDLGGTRDLRRNAGGTVEGAVAWTAPNTALTEGMGPFTPPYVDPRRVSGDPRYQNGTRETDTREAWHTVLALVHGFACRDVNTGHYLLDDPLPDHIADGTPMGRVTVALNDAVLHRDPTPGDLLELAVRCEAWVLRCERAGSEGEPPPWLDEEWKRSARRRWAVRVIAAAGTLGIVATAVFWLALTLFLAPVEEGVGDGDALAVAIDRKDPDADVDDDPVRRGPDGEEAEGEGERADTIAGAMGAGTTRRTRVVIAKELRGPPVTASIEDYDLGAEARATALGW